MTLILAVEAGDGVAVAADRGATLGGILLPSVQKVFACDQSAVWGAAGDVWVIQRVGHALEARDASCPGWTCAADAQVLRERVLDVVHPVLTKRVLEQLGQQSEISFSMLFAALLGTGPAIIQVNGDGGSGVVRDYGAVGSGTWAAVAIMRHFAGMHPGVRQAAVVAVQAMGHSIDCVPELTGPPHLALITRDGSGVTTAAVLPDADTEQYSVAAEFWRQLQAQALEYVINPPPDQVAAAPPPEPPPDGPLSE
jgi:20S proteasome alpha/beta subunit